MRVRSVRIRGDQLKIAEFPALGRGRPRITDQAIWIDLFNPTVEEEKKIERALKLDVPTREEQLEIEVSSRLYQEEGAYFMTATICGDSTPPSPPPQRLASS